MWLLTGASRQDAIGFMISLASLLSIVVTSPITHMVSSAVRAASLLGMWLFEEITVSRGACSVLFCRLHCFVFTTSVCNARTSSTTILLGSVYYTRRSSMCNPNSLQRMRTSTSVSHWTISKLQKNLTRNRSWSSGEERRDRMSWVRVLLNWYLVFRM